MDNLKKTLPSGATLEITMCSFQEGYNLMQVVAREIESINFDLGVGLKEAFEKGADVGPEAFNTVKNVIARAIGSNAIKEALGPIILRGLYNGDKINAKTFEAAERWGDYMAIQKEAIVYTLAPFMSGLSSLLPSKTQKGIESQSQKSS